jgi:hypothetical protein
MLLVSLQIAGTHIAQAAQSKIFLKIEVISSKGVQKQWSLTCGPTGGNHPNKVKVCKFLSSNKGKLALFVESREDCTQIYGGSASATIKGRYQDKKVELILDRSDGCGIESWDRLIQILRLT